MNRKCMSIHKSSVHLTLIWDNQEQEIEAFIAPIIISVVMIPGPAVINAANFN